MKIFSNSWMQRWDVPPLHAVCFALFWVTATTASHAQIVINASEVGGDVVLDFSGSLNLPGSSSGTYTGGLSAQIQPSLLITGSSGGPWIRYTTSSSPSSNISALRIHGSSTASSANSFRVVPSQIWVHSSYISNAAMSGSVTFASQSFDSFGWDPAGESFVWTLAGTGDTITLNTPAYTPPAPPPPPPAPAPPAPAPVVTPVVVIDLTGSDVFAGLSGFTAESAFTFTSTTTHHLRHQAMSGPPAPGGGSAAVSPAMIADIGGVALSQALSTDYGWDVWAQGYGQGGDIGDSDTSGLNYGTGGVAFGVDHWLNHQSLIGLFGGWSSSNADLDSGMASTDAESWRVGLHAVHRLPKAYLLGSFYYGESQYEGQRYLPLYADTAFSDYDGEEWGAYLEFGIPLFSEATQWKIQPLIAYQFLSIHQDRFTETGAGTGNLTVSQEDTDSSRLSAGAFLSRDLFVAHRKLTPYLDIRWTKEFNDDPSVVTGTLFGGGSFQTQGLSLGDDFLDLSAGTVFEITPRTSLTLGYEGRFSEDSSFNGGMGQVRVSF